MSARLGEINGNRFGTKMEIVEYRDSHNIIVEFKDKTKYKVKTSYRHFKNGGVRNVYDLSVFGIGFLGEGGFLTKIGDDHTPEYIRWKGMLERCYDYKYHKKEPTYIGCTVCKEWHNFQNFAKWHRENFYQFPGEIMQIDKDILLKNNKVYSPDTCIFVPQTINNLFTKRNRFRGDCLIGVHSKGDAFISQCNDGSGKKVMLGEYKSQEEAFKVYKDFKEKIIKYVASKYEDLIPENLYNALIKYKVEEND